VPLTRAAGAGVVSPKRWCARVPAPTGWRSPWPFVMMLVSCKG
jgi:hypothetical protein